MTNDNCNNASVAIDNLMFTFEMTFVFTESILHAYIVSFSILRHDIVLLSYSISYFTFILNLTYDYS